MSPTVTDMVCFCTTSPRPCKVRFAAAVGADSGRCWKSVAQPKV